MFTLIFFYQQLNFYYLHSLHFTMQYSSVTHALTHSGCAWRDKKREKSRIKNCGEKSVYKMEIDYTKGSFIFFVGLRFSSRFFSFSLRNLLSILCTSHQFPYAIRFFRVVLHFIHISSQSFFHRHRESLFSQAYTLYTHTVFWRGGEVTREHTTVRCLLTCSFKSFNKREKKRNWNWNRKRRSTSIKTNFIKDISRMQTHKENANTSFSLFLSNHACFSMNSFDFGFHYNLCVYIYEFLFISLPWTIRVHCQWKKELFQTIVF